MTDQIRLEIDGPIARLTLARAEKLNALRTSDHAEVNRFMRDFAADPHIVGTKLEINNSALTVVGETPSWADSSRTVAVLLDRRYRPGCRWPLARSTA